MWFFMYLAIFSLHFTMGPFSGPFWLQIGPKQVKSKFFVYFAKAATGFTWNMLFFLSALELLLEVYRIWTPEGPYFGALC